MTPLPYPDHARRRLGPALRAALASQNPQLDDDVLSSPELGVVVTGQQVGLFLGPAYSTYKAMTALALADRLTRRGKPTIAVFWLQSEDHDHREIAAASVLDDADEVATLVASATGDARASMAQRKLTDDVAMALASLAEHLEGAPHREATLELLSRHYRPGAGWVEAFGGAMREVLGPMGLWVLDPRCPELAAEAIPIHRRALLEHEHVGAATLRGAETVDVVGVAPRPECSLSFFHPHGADGGRFRPTRQGEGWTWPGADGPVSTNSLVERLEAEPLAFSTSSLLRLMLQERWLPTVAHVVGPGEARYVAQAPPLHTLFGLHTPAPIIRARLVLVEPSDRRKLDALGLDALDVDDEEATLRHLSLDDPGPAGAEVEERLLAAVDATLGPLAAELQDLGVQPAIERTKRHVEKGVKALARRVDQARAHRDARRSERVASICSRLRPQGSPQERVLTFPHFAARYGVTAWTEAVRGAVETHLDRLEAGFEGQLQAVELA